MFQIHQLYIKIYVCSINVIDQETAVYILSKIFSTQMYYRRKKDHNSNKHDIHIYAKNMLNGYVSDIIITNSFSHI